MSLTPIFPQFGRACAEFVKPQGFPRPFGGLDWCPRCGQPDWGHQAGAADRVRRLDGLDPDDMADALAYLAEYSPGALDIALDAIRMVGYGAEADGEEVPFCINCNGSLAIFAADGPYYRHYRDAEDGDAERYSVDHPTVIGWRQPTRP